jgi:glutamate-1-semialdehyde 2,1-aminomutase
MNINKNSILWNRAIKVIPGGNSFLSKNPSRFPIKNWPTYFSKAKGCSIWDLNNKKFYDFSFMGVGTNILGYADGDVDRAVINEINKSNMCTLNAPAEVKLAEELIRIHPWSSMAKFARTGAEANLIAIRLARAFTKKNKVIICGYHGWHDWYLSAKFAKIYNNLDTHLFKDLKIEGVDKNLKNSTYSVNYNDLNTIKKLIKKDKDIACIIMEVERDQAPKKNFLQLVRKICSTNNIILIFDECTSGFRVNYGGLHLRHKVYPDLAMFGKAIGNGYAITAIIGKKKVMSVAKKTFLSSTFWSEKIGFVAALATLRKMKKIKSYDKLISKSLKIKKGLEFLAKKNNISITFTGLEALINFEIKGLKNEKLNKIILSQMLDRGFLAGNKIYVSVSHTDKLINQYLKNMNNVFKKIKKIL